MRRGYGGSCGVWRGGVLVFGLGVVLVVYLFLSQRTICDALLSPTLLFSPNAKTAKQQIQAALKQANAKTRALGNTRTNA